MNKLYVFKKGTRQLFDIDETSCQNIDELPECYDRQNFDYEIEIVKVKIRCI